MTLLRRVLAVLASVFLIAAIAVGTLADPALPLGHAIYLLGGVPDAVEWVRAHSPDWFWSHAMAPLLIRPAWLLPAAIGMVAGGLSLTLPQPDGKRKVRRS